MDGEKAVGQYLESLREKGCAVFHDIDCGGFNLDHVIISERGVFVVETKTLSKPARGNPTIKYDGSGITAGSVRLRPNPVEQVRAGADWLRQFLSESIGRNFKVRSAVVFPGWFVESSARHDAGSTWVINPKGLPAFIRNERSSICREDKKLAAYHLSRYIRTT
ncbi:MAG TPA: nuclease-related domain-containing protein [Thermodesulfobacteriota bacterium]|nr:nuclease-related domain-containing protein [Thermodesulfobacteriota bacterium]